MIEIAKSHNVPFVPDANVMLQDEAAVAEAMLIDFQNRGEVKKLINKLLTSFIFTSKRNFIICRSGLIGALLMLLLSNHTVITKHCRQLKKLLITILLLLQHCILGCHHHLSCNSHRRCTNLLIIQ